MANVPRRKIGDQNKYEKKAYLTYEEASDYLGVKRSTLYSAVNEMGIETHKFRYDKKRYLALADVKRIKEIREKPWLAGKEEEKPEGASDEELPHVVMA